VAQTGDTSVGDAGSVGDAASENDSSSTIQDGSVTDTGTVGFGDSGPFCSSLSPAPTLCTDLGSQWDTVGAPGIVSVLALEPGLFVSAPNGYRATTPANQTTGKYIYAFLQHQDKATVVNASIDSTIDWYFDGTSFAGINTTSISEISIPREHAYDLSLRIDSSGTLVVSELLNDSGGTYPTATTLTPKTWYRFRIVYNHTANTLTLYVNGVKKLDAQPLSKAPPDAGAGYEWRVGSATQANTAAFNSVVDNLAIDIK